MAEIFSVNGRNLSSAEFVEALKIAGICYGDTVCVHSNFLRFGRILGSRDEFFGAIKDAFLSVLGEAGTLIVPTFSYSFCRGEVYDKNSSKCTVGAFGEYFRKISSVYRTDCPIFSHAVLGANMDKFKLYNDDCFGTNSAFATLHKMGGKIVLLGLNGEGFTFNMYAEQNAGVSYRYFKDFSGEIIDENGLKSQKSVKYFVRDIAINPQADRQKRLKFMLENGAAKCVEFGLSDICVIDAKKAFDILVDQMKKHEKYFLKENR